jgi:CheY-specific phosphatase CheX
MDPLLDEKIIVLFSQIIPEYFYENYNLLFKREAFGPSLNEGISYEFSSYVDFSGDITGRLFLCMDGATKLKILPYLSKFHHVDTYQKGMANSILMEIINQIASLFSEEFSYAKINIKIFPPEINNHVLYRVDFDKFRQYVLIFNVYADSHLIGRVYFIILLEK